MAVDQTTLGNKDVPRGTDLGSYRGGTRRPLDWQLRG